MSEHKCGKCGSTNLNDLAHGHGKGTIICLKCEAKYWKGMWRTKKQWDKWINQIEG